VAGTREERQLGLIEEFASLAEGARVECWLRGGWALDFLLGRVTRPHEDIDLFIWASDASKLVAVLERYGYEEVEVPKALAHEQRDKDPGDLALLRRAVADGRRR
jgi:phosphorylcholine metabolism protein LicD